MKKTTTLLIALFISIAGFSQTIFEDGFEAGNTNANVPTGWFCGETPKWMAGNGDQSHNRTAHTGEWYAYFPYNSDSWMFRQVDLTANETYEFSMWYKTDGVEGFQYEVKYGSDTLEAAMSNTIHTLEAINNTEYQQLIATFTPTTSGTFYIGIHGVSTNSPWYLSVDDIKLETVVDYSFELTRITNDTIVHAGSSYDYLVAIKNIGTNTDSYTLSSSSDWNVEFYDKTGTSQISTLSLDSYVTDTIIVRQFVPAEGVELEQTDTAFITVASQTVYLANSVEIITTAVSPITTFPYQQGFDNTAIIPVGWNSEIVSGNYAFEMVTEGSTPDCTPHDNSEGMIFYRSFSASDGSVALFSSPPIGFTNAEYIVRFWVYRTANIDNKADKIEIYRADDENLTSSTLLGTVHRATNFEPVESSEGWFEYSYVFTTTESVQYIVFKAVSAYGWNMYIDNVTVNLNVPDETAPEFISITETQQYADLEMPLTVVIRDESQVTETMQGIYNVGNGDEAFDMLLSTSTKGNYTYTGSIPAQTDGASGTVKFVMEDVEGNTAETDAFPVSWSGVAPLLEESFEGDFPPVNWTVQGEPLTWFIWSQVGTELYEDSDEVSYTVVPKHGEKQAMVGWDYQENAQDEWLISPEIEITDLADLSFETFAQYGSMWYDHYTVSVSTDGINWTELWDAFMENTMVNQYDQKVTLSLDAYVGQTIRVAWRAYNSMYDPFWYSWFIDDVRIEKRNGVGISENSNSLEFDFEIMPNPVANTLNIKTQGKMTKQFKIQIYNTSGQLMQCEALSNDGSLSQVTSVDVSVLNSGVYICKINSGINQTVKKFVVEKK
jgi:hypothetical protein